MTKKQKANAAFLEKIKTIGISTGQHHDEAPECPDCGTKMKLVGVGIARVVHKQQPKPEQEESFAA